MKMRKGSVWCAGFFMVLVLLVAAPLHAQVAWDSWVDQWFQGTITDKGVMVNESGTDKATDNANAYGYVSSYVSSLDGDQYTFLLFKRNPDTGDWIGPLPYVAKVVGGTPLNYVTYGFIPPSPEGRAVGIELFALIMNITGKEKKGELTSPSATAIAGCVIYINSGGYYAANETLTFKSAKKVPDELLGRIPR